MQDRIYVGWEGGYFLTTAGPIAGSEFVEQFHEMVAEHGRPDVVEFRSADEGYITDDCDEDDENCDDWRADDDDYFLPM
jgi:hypothetical protein